MTQSEATMTTDQVQTLVQGIVHAAQDYDVSKSTQAHLAIIGQASMLIRSVVQPAKMVGIHGTNVGPAAQSGRQLLTLLA